MNIEYSFLDFISEVDPTGQHSNELVELYKKRLDEMDSRSTNYFAFEDKVGLPFNSEGIINSQRLAFIEFLGKEEFENVLGITDDNRSYFLFKKLKSINIINEDNSVNHKEMENFTKNLVKNALIKTLGEEEYKKRYEPKQTLLQKIKSLF
jgi:hypothetical protein